MAERNGTKSAGSEVQVSYKPRILPISNSGLRTEGVWYTALERGITQLRREDRDRRSGTRRPPAYKPWTWEVLF